MSQKEDLAVAQAAVNIDYGHLKPKVTSVIFMCGGDEALVTTNVDEIKYLHGEYSMWCGKKQWSFDEHAKDEFKSKKEFYEGYGY